MAVSTKRLCVRTLLSRPSCTQKRLISTTSPHQASPNEDIDLDRLTSQPGVKYTSTESPSDLAALKTTDLSARAHRQLEQHRELREMVRLAAWEMPLLSSLTKTFEPPKKEQILRWRYTTYMGEAHPAARKVVVVFQPEMIDGLQKKQLLKLLKLAGPRYNPGTKTIKMSCESFETQAQNKRYLATTITNLIAAAKNPEGDQFTDVPLDTRHYKPKTRYSFPAEWAVTPERRKVLEEKRKQAMLEDGRRVEEGRLVSGVSAIEEGRKLAAVKAVEEPVMAEARRGVVKGKVGGRREMPGQRWGRVR